MLQFAVDTGGTFTDLVVDGDEFAAALLQAVDDPVEPVEGLLDVFAGGSRRSRAQPGRVSRPRPELLVFGTTRATNAVVTGNDRPDGAALHTGSSGHPALPGGRRPDDAVRLHAGIPGAVRAAVAHLRGPRAGALRRHRPHAARRARGGRSSPSAYGSSRSRRSPSVCSGRSSTRRTKSRIGELLAELTPGDPRHAVARAQPEPARVPAGIVDGDRRVAEAADEPLLRRARDDGSRRTASTAGC